MTILVDIDSTVTNFGEALLSVLNDRSLGHDEPVYQYSNIVSYDWFDKIYINPWEYTHNKSFWDIVKVNPIAVTTLESWVKQGHKVLLVTASHFNDALGYKIRKTLEPFNSELINERNVIITQDKSVIMGDVMIDDFPDNLYSFNGTRICYAQPWNQDFNGSLRLSDWDKINEAIKLIQSIYFDEDVAF